MGKQKNSPRQPGTLQPATVAGVLTAADANSASANSADPAGDRVLATLSFMMFLVPAIGVPDELLLQDTLKSMVASLTVLGAALILFCLQRQRMQAFRWHVLMWLPISLMFYALGSMAWSHDYLGGVEAIRWFIFSLLLWLGMNTLTRERLAGLTWGIHLGAVIASLWVALQFWIDFRIFPQGPNSASTFVNRIFLPNMWCARFLFQCSF